MRRTGFARLPLHYGRAPRWLVVRMQKLAKEMVTVIIDEYGRDDFLRRISDPFWFQALGCVLGYDWHSSGVTTVVTGVLKNAAIPEEHGIAVCGGKGKASRQAPLEIQNVGEKFGFSTNRTEALRYASKMSAKVDNAAIQAGYQLYQHDKNGINTTILNFLVHLDKIGKRKEQIRNTNWCLTHLSKHCDLNKPETVNQYIQYLQKSNGHKTHLTQVYGTFCKFHNIPYKRPRYTDDSKPIHPPTHEKINMIIANSGKTLALKLTISYKTGIRPVELHELKVKDHDAEQKVIYPTTAKHGTPRTFKIDTQLNTLIQRHIIRNNLQPNDKLFKGTERSYSECYRRTRNRLATKLNDPSIKTIRLYDLRHYYGTKLYKDTNNLLLTAQQMGHKRLDTTRRYVHLETDEEKDYIVESTKDEKRVDELLTKNFTYILTTPDGYMKFRKRK